MPNRMSFHVGESPHITSMAVLDCAGFARGRRAARAARVDTRSAGGRAGRRDAVS